MNRIGLHYNYWNGTGVEKDLYKALELTEKAGADVFEFGSADVLRMTKAERASLKKRMMDKGITPSVNGGAPPDWDMASADLVFRSQSVDAYKRTADAISETGSPIWSGVIYSRWLRLPDGPVSYEEKQQTLDIALASLRELVGTLADCNLVCCFEIVNRYEQFLLNTAKEGVEFTDRLDSPYGKLLLDTFHMNIEEDNMADAIRYAMTYGRLGHVHVGESNRRLPGIGKTQIDWREFFSAVRESGYQGFITLEPMVLMGTPFARKVNVWRDMADRSLAAMLDDARNSIQFIRKQIQL
ncbi:MAG TPA: TIM barrel protein [Anaerovoracaceae bacterium]|nr:TIM barrel protein [Anaerovoracaceae bacterium]